MNQPIIAHFSRVCFLFLFVDFSFIKLSYSKTTYTIQESDEETIHLHTHEIPVTNLSVPLFESQSSHHVHIYIGSPAQRRIVIVDTGSRLLVYPCEPCRRCGNNHISESYFDPKISFTDNTNDCEKCVFNSRISKCRQNQCTFVQSFTEGSSMTGYEVEDIAWFGTESIEESTKVYMYMAVPITFGCQDSEKGLISNQYADGILGLIGLEDHNNIITKMFVDGTIPHHAFSLCLRRYDGILSIGGTSLTNRHLERMETIPLSKNNGYFSIDIQDFYIGGVPIKSKNEIPLIFNKGKGTILDSGTSDTYLPIAIANEFKRVWTEVTNGQSHSNFWKSFTLDEYKILPNITLTLQNGYQFVIQPSQYMEPDSDHDTTSSYETWNGQKRFACRIYLDEPIGCVLGANAMFDHDILFDLGKSMIGIARADCK
mmetsp:Transcript_6199/g.7850  ORF Transcript_6199/g.7850 Transcript_6199/m.7850 type:complete len:428 (+) Transcript_6199:242-1525(+)